MLQDSKDEQYAKESFTKCKLIRKEVKKAMAEVKVKVVKEIYNKLNTKEREMERFI